THGCELAHPVIEGMADDLDSLALQVANFPVADARVLITWSGRNNEYAVKVSLILPGETLVASDHDPALHAAYARAVASLEDAVAGYKERLDQVADRRRQEVGTRQEVTAATPVDIAAVDAAAASGDYPAFRAAVAPYEDSLRLRVGRWVERYPAVASRLGKGLNVNDLMEAVFLDAFEGNTRRPSGER